VSGTLDAKCFALNFHEGQKNKWEKGINPKNAFQSFSCRHVWKKRSGSSFVSGYLSVIPASFDSIRLTAIDTQILHWRGFDAHVPACFPVKCILVVNGIIEK